jgi:F0F1-type ATP synthase alpha subunit
MPGMIVRNTNDPMCVQVNTLSLGCVVDCLGYPIMRSYDFGYYQFKFSYIRHIKSTPKYLVERPAPGIILRQPIFQPLHTGNIVVDSLFPIGRGQRELIVGNRQTGKTTVAINAIKTQKYDTLVKSFNKKIYCIYVSVGQKKLIL